MNPRLTYYPTVFLDLDGVMADFDADFERRTGFTPAAFCDEFGDDAMWGLINSWDNFFENLPPMPGALEAYAQIVDGIGVQPIILTACPRSNYKGVADQKRRWVRKHLGPRVIVIPTCGGSTKPRFMQHRADVLIDDFERNTTAWAAEGGEAILHTGNWEATLERLEMAVL